MSETTDKLESLIDGTVNVGFGAVAAAVEIGNKTLEELNSKGKQARANAKTPDFVRPISDVVDSTNEAVADLVDRMAHSSEQTNDRILDELIRFRVKRLDDEGRAAYLAHVTSLVQSIDEVKVEATVVDECDGTCGCGCPVSPVEEPEVEECDGTCGCGCATDAQ